MLWLWSGNINAQKEQKHHLKDRFNYLHEWHTRQLAQRNEGHFLLGKQILTQYSNSH